MARKASITALHAELIAKTQGYETDMRRAAMVTRSTEQVIVKSMRGAANSTHTFNAAQQAAQKSARTFRTNIQMTGYQLQDFAVQVAGGQSALVAFSQQGSQLLGIFGPAGAIAGAVLAVSALAAQFASTSNEMKEATAAADELVQALEGLSGARSNRLLSRMGLEDQSQFIQRQIDTTQQSIDSRIAQMEKLRAVATELQADATGPLQGGNKDFVTLLVNYEGEMMRPNTALDQVFEKQKALQTEAYQLEADRVALTEKLRAVSEKLTQETMEANKAFTDRLLDWDHWVNDLTNEMAAMNVAEADAAGKNAAEQIRQQLQIDQAKAEHHRRQMARINAEQDALTASRVDLELKNFFGDLDEESRKSFGKMTEVQKEMSQMWNDVSDRAGQAATDMVMTWDGKMSDLIGIVADAAAQIAVRLSLINPVLNGVIGLFGGEKFLPASWGRGASVPASPPALARGGTMEAGEWTMVGENGPELVRAGRTSTVIPAEKTAAALSGAGGRSGTTVYIDAKGADAAAISRLWAAFGQINANLEQRSLGSVVDRSARSVSFG